MDTLFENGAVLTLEDGARTAEALLVRDGRIVLAGTREEAGQLAGTGARRVDLQGHTLLPAFIDPHGHFSAAANALLQVPLDECADLEEIAGRFFISKSYLSRIFKEVTGFTVNEYLNIRRIMKAKQLLSTPEPNVTAISEMLGYENVSYFERVFKKYAHTTPLRFRRQVWEDKKQLTERMGQSIIINKC